MTISDLSTLKRHLGVNWTFGEDEHGRFLESSMPAFIDSIMKDYEKYMETPSRTFQTPGSPGTPPMKNTTEDTTVNMEDFRSYVRRIMFSVEKTDPYCVNTCHELDSAWRRALEVTITCYRIPERSLPRTEDETTKGMESTCLCQL